MNTPDTEKQTKVYLEYLPKELRDYINFNASNGKIAAVEIVGDSMMPTIQHGGAVIIDTTNLSIDSGYAYVFEKENLYPNSDMKSFCKRLHINDNGEITIKSENAKYKDFHFNSINDLKIIGKVLAARPHDSQEFYPVDDKYEQQYLIPIIKNTSDLLKHLDRQKQG